MILMKKQNTLRKLTLVFLLNKQGCLFSKSMGYGVPYISSKDAITGGELLNIHNGKDGIIMDDESQLTEVIRDIAMHRDKYLEMGRKAQEFCNEYRTPQHMADGLWNAVKYAMEQ